MATLEQAARTALLEAKAIVVGVLLDGAEVVAPPVVAVAPVAAAEEAVQRTQSEQAGPWSAGCRRPSPLPPSPAVVPLVVEATVLEQVAAARVPVAAGAVAAADGRRWSGGWHLWRPYHCRVATREAPCRAAAAARGTARRRACRGSVEWAGCVLRHTSVTNHTRSSVTQTHSVSSYQRDPVLVGIGRVRLCVVRQTLAQRLARLARTAQCSHRRDGRVQPAAGRCPTQLVPRFDRSALGGPSALALG